MSKHVIIMGMIAIWISLLCSVLFFYYFYYISYDITGSNCNPASPYFNMKALCSLLCSQNNDTFISIDYLTCQCYNGEVSACSPDIYLPYATFNANLTFES